MERMVVGAQRILNDKRWGQIEQNEFDFRANAYRHMNKHKQITE